MKEKAAEKAAEKTPAKPKFRYCGGTGSIIQFRTLLDKLDTPKAQEVLKKGRIVDMTDPLKVVEIDDKGRDGKTVEVALVDVVCFLSEPPKADGKDGQDADDF